MNTKNLLLGIAACCLAEVGFAQDVLTLEKAINTSLKNNYNIRLERYNEEVSENNVSRAVSGQLPRLDLNSSYERGYADAELQTLNLQPSESESPPLELDGTSQTLLVQPQLTVPIFTGFRNKYRYKQLENTHRMSELQLEAVTEQAISGTVSAYLEMARWQAQLEIDRENIAISQDRWLRVSEDAKFGAANSVQRLQAEVDLKTDSANYRSSVLAYQNSRRDLNLVMALPPEQEFVVQPDVALSEGFTYDQLREDMVRHNTQLRLSERRIDQSVYETKISEATYYPTVQGYANYTYLDTEDEANFLQSNTAYGPNAGVTLSWNLFSGGANRIQRQNARIQQNQQETALDQTALQLEKELRNAYAQYANNREQLRIEQSNVATFERNYTKVQEDYKLGLVDAADLRTAQLNLTAARNRINNLTYNIKQSEIRLLQLSGRLATE